MSTAGIPEWKNRLPLLSFIYRLYTEPEFQTLFRKDPEAAMDAYELTWDQKVAIYHSGANPTFVTRNAVPGYPILLDGNKVATNAADESNKGPNPLSADWWGAYAQYMAAKIAGVKPPPVPPSPQVNDRPSGDRVSLAGVMLLLGEELAQKQNWDPEW